MKQQLSTVASTRYARGSYGKRLVKTRRFFVRWHWEPVVQMVWIGIINAIIDPIPLPFLRP